MPLDSMHCVSETFLHEVLRALVCQNLGNHAFQIATSCSNLPYFHHTLELMLHGVSNFTSTHLTFPNLP